MDNQPVRDLIKQAGGPVTVAKALNLTHGAVSQWRRVPAQHVTVIAEMAGVQPHQIRPDVFPPPPGTDSGGRRR